ncbi:MAG TPA: HhoA/HhoB/HtrA family serine endopeptidase [Candidatus Obscuribacterales bacterium]
MQFHSRFCQFLIRRLLALVVGVAITVTPLEALLSTQAIAAPLPVTESNQSGSFVAAAVKRVGPAVVRIDTERTITRKTSPDPFFDDPFSRRFFGREFSPRRPRGERLRGLGSGFIVDRTGIALTNAHVVNGADKVMVTLKDGRMLQATVRGADEVTDLAVIKIEGAEGDLPVAALGDSSAVEVGDWAIAVGNPLGLDNTVTLGIVSTLKRSSAQVGIPDKRLEFIQTDAAINPGNSGGPLLSDRGEVIGINTAIRPGATGIGFAIPINRAKAIQDQLAQGEVIPHPYLGIQMATLTPALARQNNSDPNSAFPVPETNGVLVVGVLPNMPANTAGLRRGDVIVQIDGQAVTKAEELQDIVEQSRIGQELQVKVQRGNQVRQLAVQTGQLQNPAA